MSCDESLSNFAFIFNLRPSNQGVCLGLSEVLSAANRAQLADYYHLIVPTIRDALCDRDDSVRNAAGGRGGTLVHFSPQPQPFSH
jgi:hypothetical protein